MRVDMMIQLAARWNRLGAMFNTPVAQRQVDIERLLLDTARHAHANVRLLVLAVTWLSRFEKCVAKHRLANLIRHALETEHRPTMGLILDLARQKSPAKSRCFNQAIKACGHAIDHRPLLDNLRQNEFFVDLARQRACKLSLQWGRWIQDFDLKSNALRPDSWIFARNPSMRWRADWRGGLRASILAELESNPAAGNSESELARACGATRAATIDALRSLELTGRIARKRVKNRLTIRKTRRAA
jgi:hypothetical protein